MTGERLTPQRTEHRRVVVKVGSNVLTAGTDALDAASMAHLVEQIADLQGRGVQVILVTSGAVAAGRQRLRSHREARAMPARDVESRQVLAAVGQSRLMAFWDELFEQCDTPIAQALLTRHDLADRLGYLNARNTLLNLLDLGVVPVVNENDVVSVEEITDSSIGDNDNLSAQVANLV
ncbi:MAG: glutamate 5-kinase, partial [Dehalococcoidia bacterium]